MWRPLGRVREAQGCMLGPERTLARICREAGATVRMNTKLRDMNVTVEANDERAIEVLATGLPLHQGAQLAVDITLRSALTATGLATPGAAHIDGTEPTKRGNAPNCSTARAVSWLLSDWRLEAGGVPRPLTL